jgi:lipopolysaccharide export system protein LptC
VSPPPNEPDDPDLALPFSELAPLAPARAREDEALPLGPRLWGLVTAALPVVLVGLLAFVSWWMVSNAPRLDAVAPAAVASSAPDFRMQQFSMRQFTPQGQVRATVEGRQLLHYPGARLSEIEQAVLQGVDPGGIAYEARADLARVDDANTRVDLLGDATVVRQDPQGPARFRGDAVTVFTQEQRVESDRPMELQQGTSLVRANGFRYDHRSGLTELRGGVRGSMAAGS